MSTPSERAWALFPAGSPGEYNLPRELTVVLSRGQGATVWDTDGRAFTDFTMGWGSVILGHAHCGGVKAFAEKAAPLSPGDFIGNWMRLMAPAAETVGPQRALPWPDYLTRCGSRAPTRGDRPS